MADCIFNGTVKRPPMGLAEVTITMEDPELADAARFVLETADIQSQAAATPAEAAGSLITLTARMRRSQQTTRITTPKFTRSSPRSPLNNRKDARQQHRRCGRSAHGAYVRTPLQTPQKRCG